MKLEPYRSTIHEKVMLPRAIGTLSLRPVTVGLEPAEIGAGLRVQRTDTGQEWPLSLETLVDSVNCTAVGDETGAVAFLEHLLAALWAGRISDVLITTDGPEIPLYDGSASALWAAVVEAGRHGSTEPWEPLVVREPCHLLEEGRALLALPSGGRQDGCPTEASGSCFTYLLEHPHPLIGKQFVQFCSGDDFGSEIAPARTFATAEQIRATRGQEPGPEVEALCLVVYQYRLSEEPELPESFARHKLLDLVGDLFLCGRPVEGVVMAARTGHGDNHEFLRRLLAQE
ncbi:MAG: UDP-3-O-acyl-N-acetylglucosamine deacetylase [Armatimonadota bacterium]